MAEEKPEVRVEGTEEAGAGGGSGTTAVVAEEKASGPGLETTSGTDAEKKGTKRKEPEKPTDAPIRPITDDGDMPQKRYYRSRAHCNPLSHNSSFPHPPEPSAMDWSVHYPALVKPLDQEGAKEDTGEGGSSSISTSASTSTPTANGSDDAKGTGLGLVSIVDVGCGYGGLTVTLSKEFPDEVILGMEIRAKIAEYVRLRIEALRAQEPGSYQNASVIKTNSMLYLPNYFVKGQLKKMFFCFPDPHFKAKNHRRRIVTSTLLTEYAYFLRPGGLLYCITDVEDLHNWHVEKLTNHPLFERLTDEEMEADPAVKIMTTETEEGKKVERNKGNKHWVVHRRLPDDQVQASLLDLI